MRREKGPVWSSSADEGTEDDVLFPNKDSSDIQREEIGPNYSPPNTDNSNQRRPEKVLEGGIDIVSLMNILGTPKSQYLK